MAQTRVRRPGGPAALAVKAAAIGAAMILLPVSAIAQNEPAPPDANAAISTLATTATPAPDDQAAAIQAAASQAATDELARDARRAEEAQAEQEQLIAAQTQALAQTEAAQTELSAQLDQIDAGAARTAEEAKTWQIKAARLTRDGADTPSIDTAYDELTKELTTIRKRFAGALGEGKATAIAGIKPDRVDPLLDAERTDAAGLNARFEALDAEAKILQSRADTVAEARHLALYEAMDGMNAARLVLTPELSDAKRAKVEGFDREGVVQAGHEVEQLFLEMRYRLQGGVSILPDGHLITPKLVFDLIWIVLALLIFRFWRGRGDTILMHAHDRAVANQKDNLASVMKVRLIAVWHGVRRPLDYVVLLLVLRWLWPAQYWLDGVAIIWLVLFWTSCTFFLLRLVNELASDQSRNDPRAELRWRSLRLIGVIMLVSLLTLQIVEVIVGRGTVYAWIASLVWIAIPALIVVLTVWWHNRISELAKAEEERSAFLAWIAQRPLSVATFIPYVFAGASLLARSLVAAVKRETSRFSLVREFGQQKEREEAAARVAANKASGMYHSLPDEAVEILYPHRNPHHDATARSQPEKLVLPKLTAGTIVAVVGDRGLGKSTLMRDAVSEADGFDQCVSLGISTRGFSGMMEDLVKNLDLKASPDDIQAVAREIAALPERLIVTIDDVHRAIVPAINGLDDFDLLTALGRAMGAGDAMVMTIERSSWDFLDRARADRLVFDEVVVMPRWSCEDMRDLIERRTAQAGLDPDFSNVIDSGAFAINEDVTPEERRKAQYFRRLHDYTDGNPAIALEFWRRSLFVVGETGQVVALTFERPNGKKLSSLPLPAMLVLRAILQMGQASDDAIHRNTNLPRPTIEGALRRLQREHVIEAVDDRHMITLGWWLEARRLLERRNLVVGRKA